MANFSDLPYELRTAIFALALPEPRVLHIIRAPPKPLPLYKRILIYILLLYQNLKDRLPSEKTFRVAPKIILTAEDFTVSSASYGKHHPAILSINHESRTFALKTLRKHLGVYWNFAIDFAYFEVQELADESVLVLANMYHAGLLEPFQNIALDNLLWLWHRVASGMEFRRQHAELFVANPDPIHIFNVLPNLKNVTVTFAAHTTQLDRTVPYQSWSLGPYDGVLAMEEWMEGRRFRDSVGERGFIIVNRIDVDGKWFLVKDGVDVDSGVICGREREVAVVGK